MENMILQQAGHKCDYCLRIHQAEPRRFQYERKRIKVCEHCYQFLTEPVPDLKDLLEAVLNR